MTAIAAAARTLLHLFVDDIPSALATIALLVACGMLAHHAVVEGGVLGFLLVSGSVGILMASVTRK